jgi:branched-chain amino acid transport system ATP-binding protein
MSEIALSAQRVAVHYGKFTAVESATFDVRVGELLAVIGPNGHGKSSLVGAIAGVVPRRGTVTAFGTVLHSGDARHAVRTGVVLVPERRHLYPGMTVQDNVLLGNYARLRTIWAARAWAQAKEALDLFPELAQRYGQSAGTLSGGEQQMVAIARALAGRPRLLLLDEPCLGLAESVSARVYEALRELNRRGVTIVLVEENPKRALAICDREIRMYRGIIGEGQAAEAAPAVLGAGSAR